MTTLPDRVADLAEGAPVSPPPPDLWRPAFSGIVSTAVVTRVQADVEPAGTREQRVPPDRFYVPSGRLPVAHGATGPLVRVVPAEHVSWSGRGEMGLVGVSARWAR